MTKAKALRNYFKSVYGLDLEGMSEVETLRAFFRANGIDSSGSTVSAVLQNAVNAGFQPSGGAAVKTARIKVMNSSNRNINISVPYAYVSNDGRAFAGFVTVNEGDQLDIEVLLDPQSKMALGYMQEDGVNVYTSDNTITIDHSSDKWYLTITGQGTLVIDDSSEPI